MPRNVALFDVVKAIQVAEREAFDSLGAKTVVEARQKRRAAARARKVKRWRYVQLRANAGLTRAQGAVTEGEVEASIELDTADAAARAVSEPTPSPKTASILHKLLKW